jgi:D-aminoacyl-tRNA deacylase
VRIVIQRVKHASVAIDGAISSSIGNGILVLIGIHKDDSPSMADFLAAKCAELRMFQDDNDKMNRSLLDTGGSALVVSQFTLYGDCAKGRRPSFTDAAGPDKGRELYEYFVLRLRDRVKTVETGVFGAKMDVELVNDGPVTFVLDA